MSQTFWDVLPAVLTATAMFVGGLVFAHHVL